LTLTLIWPWLLRSYYWICHIWLQLCFFIYWFDLYVDKRTLMAKAISWVIQKWPWPLFDLDFQGQIIKICLNCHHFYFYGLIHIWTHMTKKYVNLWPWAWFVLDLQGQIIEICLNCNNLVIYLQIHMTKVTWWIIQILPWPFIDLDH
jgi:hypothetical protein